VHLPIDDAGHPASAIIDETEFKAVAIVDVVIDVGRIEAIAMKDRDAANRDESFEASSPIVVISGVSNVHNK